MLEHPLFLCDDPDVQRREKLESPPPQLIAQFKKKQILIEKVLFTTIN
jgi:hypothetical protein